MPTYPKSPLRERIFIHMNEISQSSSTYRKEAKKHKLNVLQKALDVLDANNHTDPTTKRIELLKVLEENPKHADALPLKESKVENLIIETMGQLIEEIKEEKRKEKKGQSPDTRSAPKKDVQESTAKSSSPNSGFWQINSKGFITKGFITSEKNKSRSDQLKDKPTPPRNKKSKTF